MRFLYPIVGSLCLLAMAVVSASAARSTARVWDEAILAGIRIDKLNPPVHARNLFHLSVAIYDAWAAYDNVAVGYLFREKHTATNLAAARCQAISYAAYRLLKERYAYSASATNTLPALDALMASLGYDTNNVSTDTSTPAGLGNRVYAVVSAYFLYDGANQTASYQDFPANRGGYAPINPPLVTGLPGDTNIVDVKPLAAAGHHQCLRPAQFPSQHCASLCRLPMAGRAAVCSGTRRFLQALD